VRNRIWLPKFSQQTPGFCPSTRRLAQYPGICVANGGRASGVFFAGDEVDEKEAAFMGEYPAFIEFT
jgi:hypothetical protein